MDRFAIRMMERLSEEKAPDGMTSMGFLKLQMDSFKMCETWLAKRKKLAPAGVDEEGSGVTALREMMNSPTALLELLGDNPEALDKILVSRGYVKLPPKGAKAGRPVKAVVDARREAKAAIAAHKEKQANAQPGAGWAAMGIAEQ